MTPMQRIHAQLLALERDPHLAPGGRSGTARCPVASHGKCNGDRRPSLGYGERADGSVWLRCYAGCEFADLLAALGLTARDCYHDADDQAYRRPRHVVLVHRRATAGEATDRLERVAAHYRQALDAGARDSLARSLGLTPASLMALEVGWDNRYRGCWTFPMRDGNGRLVGFRLRRLDGSKYTLTGTHEGLFIPAGLPSGGRLVVTEGPTDTAALLGLGIDAVGRPSCLGGVLHVVRLVRRLHFAEVGIAADRDGPGQRGAEKLAAALVLHAAVRVVTPPAKDMRAWIAQGRARATDVAALIDAAPVHHLRVVVAAGCGRPRP